MCKILNYHFYILGSIFALFIMSCEDKHPESVSIKYNGDTTSMVSNYKIDRYGFNDSLAVYLTDPFCSERQDGVISIRNHSNKILYYDWENTDNSYNTDELYELSAGDYKVTVSDDNNNFAVISIELYSQYKHCIFIPSFFTPNGDCMNDIWFIEGLDYPAYSHCSVAIYNASGLLLYYTSGGYNEPWDGTYRNKRLPEDDYYYKIDLYGDGKKFFEGTVTLIYNH